MNWVDSYKKLADLYIEEFESRWKDGEDTALKLSDYVKVHFPDVTRVLDVPCGIGRLSIPLSSRGFDVLGIDFSDKFIEYANRKKLQFGSETSRFVVGNMSSSDELILKHKPQLVINWWTSIGYNNKTTDIKFFRHLKTVTKPGTILIIETWAREYIVNFPKGRFWSDLGNLVVMVSQHVDSLCEYVESEHRYFRKMGGDLKFLGGFKSKIMLYSVFELKAMLTKAGWKVINVSNSINEVNSSFKPQLDRCLFVCESF